MGYRGWVWLDGYKGLIAGHGVSSDEKLGRGFRLGWGEDGVMCGYRVHVSVG